MLTVLPEMAADGQILLPSEVDAISSNLYLRMQTDGSFSRERRQAAAGGALWCRSAKPDECFLEDACEWKLLNRFALKVGAESVVEAELLGLSTGVLMLASAISPAVNYRLRGDRITMEGVMEAALHAVRELREL